MIDNGDEPEQNYWEIYDNRYNGTFVTKRLGELKNVFKSLEKEYGITKSEIIEYVNLESEKLPAELTAKITPEVWTLVSNMLEQYENQVL